jgi:hypothetical protein
MQLKSRLKLKLNDISSVCSVKVFSAVIIASLLHLWFGLVSTVTVYGLRDHGSVPGLYFHYNPHTS